MERLSCDGQYFRDSNGNVILFRGINLAGSSKVPLKPDGTTHFDQTVSFQNHREVSFVGRPFPLSEAEEHFKRLKSWGFNLFRLLVPWEALEHGGPGVYDEEYYEYILSICQLAGSYGFYVFIDPHQDVWSRFTGGDGAPGWTLETVGIDIEKLAESRMTRIHHLETETYTGSTWFLNYQSYPVATLFTLFFAGKILAPYLLIEGENIQTYLQKHYFSAYKKLAMLLKPMQAVLGFGSMNEPSRGYIGRRELKTFEGIYFGKCRAASPFQEMFISEGNTCDVEIWFSYGLKGISLYKKKVNKEKVSIWKPKKFCTWRMHGVWNYDPNGAPMLLRPDYFSRDQRGRAFHFESDFLKPFIRDFRSEIHSVESQFKIFVESEPGSPGLSWKEQEPTSSLINANHWYDVLQIAIPKKPNWLSLDLYNKNIIIGKKNIRKMLRMSLQAFRKASLEDMPANPGIIGEFGVPMNLNGLQALHSNNYQKQEDSLNSFLEFVESGFQNIVLWNYSPDNTFELGDRWNSEDFSIYSKDAPGDGGRALKAISRPYPVFTSGEPEHFSFCLKTRVFRYVFSLGTFPAGACILYVPEVHYPNGIKVYVSGGSYSFDPIAHLLYFKGQLGLSLYSIRVEAR
ncbi:MAG: cellulase family glycosylhydrolase [Leptospiraceae bacterium]|nr:cellulase family glycosylhydrolase [Leptospiraceae bacterium]MCP5502328.1 cellulase family glycosylhydrolase [Leptospiraceae bacterium]